jgi:hypothetical protein
MLVFKSSLVLSCLLAITTLAVAQKPKPVVKAAAQKIILPKLKTALGNRSDTMVTVSVDEATKLVTLPLTITDDKKAVYSISSYQCMYRRKGVTENEETGKVTPITSMVADIFKTTPLPEIWKKIITEQLKPGEEIFFFDVVVKNAEGRLMFAPNLKLQIQ